MTLIELLVVITILMILTVVVVPRLQPAAEGRGIREAARVVNSFLNAARNQAVATGRPVGVLIRRDPTEPNAATILEQVEIPPPYAGDQIGAVAQVQFVSGNTFQVRFRAGDLTDGLVRPGDRIQFNHQGPMYKFATPLPDAAQDANGNGFYDFAGTPPQWTASLLLSPVDTTSGYLAPWPTTPDWSSPVAFSIVRQPVDSGTSPTLRVMRSATESLTLPSRTVIDLAYSGSGAGTEFRESGTSDQTPVILMFSSTGALEKGYYQNGEHSVTGPVFLLIGKWARMADLDQNFIPDGSDDQQTNAQDLTNLWVSIGSQSGSITTSDMAVATGTDPFGRQYAQQAQSKGGR